MSQEHLSNALVKLTSDEIENIAMEHVGIVEAYAAKFDDHYLSLQPKIEDYREFLEEMDNHLTRAEELIRLLKGGEE